MGKKQLEKEKFPAQFVENQLCWEFYLFRIEIERENAYFLQETPP